MKKIILSLFLIIPVLLSGCSNSKLTTNEVEVIGKISGNLCNGVGKCIESLFLSPQGFDFRSSDWSKVKPYFNKTVKIKGSLISEEQIYSCKEDYFDGSQHPMNEKCEKTPNMKYHITNKYLKVDSISLIE